MSGRKIYFRDTFLFIYLNEADKNKLGHSAIFIFKYVQNEKIC
jgi:hypothetical protein